MSFGLPREWNVKCETANEESMKMKKLKNPTETEIVVAPNVCHVLVHVNILRCKTFQMTRFSRLPCAPLFHSTPFHHLDLVVWMDDFFSSFFLSSVTAAHNFFSASALALRFCYILVLLLVVIYCTHGLGCCCFFLVCFTALFAICSLVVSLCVTRNTSFGVSNSHLFCVRFSFFGWKKRATIFGKNRKKSIIWRCSLFFLRTLACCCCCFVFGAS